MKHLKINFPHRQAIYILDQQTISVLTQPKPLLRIVGVAPMKTTPK